MCLVMSLEANLLLSEMDNDSGWSESAQFKYYIDPSPLVCSLFTNYITYVMPYAAI